MGVFEEVQIIQTKTVGHGKGVYSYLYTKPQMSSVMIFAYLDWRALQPTVPNLHVLFADVKLGSASGL